MLSKYFPCLLWPLKPSFGCHREREKSKVSIRHRSLRSFRHRHKPADSCSQADWSPSVGIQFDFDVPVGKIYSLNFHPLLNRRGEVISRRLDADSGGYNSILVFRHTWCIIQDCFLWCTLLWVTKLIVNVEKFAIWSTDCMLLVMLPLFTEWRKRSGN